MILLSILIPTTYDRQEMLYNLLYDLHEQIEKIDSSDEIEIITELDNRVLNVGKKRQILLEKSKGEYVVFIDDDDWVSDEYIFEIIQAIKINNPDVIGFEGHMTTNGVNSENFKISKDLPYTTIYNPFGFNEYLRFNNHLSPIKRNIAIQIGYADIRFGEDYDYAKRLKESFLINTETYLPKALYHYKYVKNK